MPTYDTPGPLTLTYEVGVGDVHLVATDRDDTVVGIEPADPTLPLDVRAAEQTRVDHTLGAVTITGPKRSGLGLFGKIGAIVVTVALPDDADVRGTSGIGAIHGTGRLGSCRVKTGVGDIRLDAVGRLDASTGAGDVTVDQIAGKADVTTGSGTIVVGEVDGPAVLRNSNGDIRLGSVTGELRSKSSNGSITVTRADAAVVAKTANGDVHVGDVVRGRIHVETAMGEVEVGIRGGSAAHLDVHTSFGQVRSDLTSTDGPDASGETVDVLARTAFGDVVIRRA